MDLKKGKSIPANLFCHEDGGISFLRNIYTYLQDCTAWRATSLYYSLHRHLLKVQSPWLNSPEPGSTFQAFLGSRRFGTLFTRDRHLSLIWARWIHSTFIVYPSYQFQYLPPLSALVFQAVTSSFHSKTLSAFLLTPMLCENQNFHIRSVPHLVLLCGSSGSFEASVELCLVFLIPLYLTAEIVGRVFWEDISYSSRAETPDENG